MSTNLWNARDRLGCVIGAWASRVGGVTFADKKEAAAEATASLTI